MTNNLGQQLKERREKMFPSMEAFLSALNPVLTPNDRYYIGHNIVNIIESDDWVGLTTTHLSCVADVLKLDFDALLNNVVEEEKTQEEILQYFDGGALGTIEERVVRLVSHSVITTGRGREILKTSIWDNNHGLPYVTSTGCTCLSCREMLESLCPDSERADTDVK